MFRYFNYIFPTSKPIPLSALEMEVFPPAKRHTHTIIFLHGRDDTAAEFASSLFESQTSDGQYLQETFPSVKWIFPQAPLLPSERFGLEFPQWFDMWSTENVHDGEDAQDATQSIDAIHKILAQEERIIGAQNIILAGISQGCAVAVHALLKQPMRLGGFVGIAGWLPKPSAVANVGKRFPCALDTPVLLLHNCDDGVIAVSHGEELRDSLWGIGMTVEWRVHERGGHWINEAGGGDGGKDGGFGIDGDQPTWDRSSGVDHICGFLENMIDSSPEGRRVWVSDHEAGRAIPIPATRNGKLKGVRFQ